MSDDSFADFWRIGRCDVDHVQYAGGQTCVDEELGREMVDLGTVLGRLPDDGVACHDGVCEASDTERERCVPG